MNLVFFARNIVLDASSSQPAKAGKEERKGQGRAMFPALKEGGRIFFGNDRERGHSI